MLRLAHVALAARGRATVAHHAAAELARGELAVVAEFGARGKARARLVVAAGAAGEHESDEQGEGGAHDEIEAITTLRWPNGDVMRADTLLSCWRNVKVLHKSSLCERPRR